MHSIARRAPAGKRSYAAPALGTIDLNALPDAAMTVAILAAFCQGETRIMNVANLRVKKPIACGPSLLSSANSVCR